METASHARTVECLTVPAPIPVVEKDLSRKATSENPRCRRRHGHCAIGPMAVGNLRLLGLTIRVSFSGVKLTIQALGAIKTCSGKRARTINADGRHEGTGYDSKPLPEGACLSSPVRFGR